MCSALEEPPLPSGLLRMSAAPEQITPVEHAAAEWRCAPCHFHRVQACPTPLIILLLVGLNYFPVVLFNLDEHAGVGRVLIVVVFHLCLSLMLLSWSYTCCTDPGTPPQEWQREMAAAVERGESVNVCRRSGLYKPPRSHFDSVTERLTLNMDHFCPWVVNTVGFYNRKFFMLFLVYTNLTLLCTIISLASLAPTMIDWLQSESATARWFPPLVNLGLYVGALGIDLVLLICLLGPFMCFHLNMAMRNDTTIEGRSPAFDVGAARNLRSVFGREKWTWAIPLYLKGPDGDGVHWPKASEKMPSVATASMSVP